jgi:glycosyltransferase involved in cell wall biosynthesis
MRRRSLNPPRELALIAWLACLLKRENVDLVHGFTIKCAVYGSIAAKLARGVASVNAVAGMGYVYTSSERRARLLRPWVNLLLRCALNGGNSRLVLQNPDDVAFFTQAELVDPDKVRLVAGSGVDCARFVPDHPQRQRMPFRVLFPSRLLWDKGIGELAEAARLVRRAGRNIEFVVAGEVDAGNPAAVAPEQLRAWVDEGLFLWLGHVEDMPQLLRSADLVVLPSYREGLPRSLIEAAACGLPLVTTDVPGCREVVRNEKEGLLVPPKDAGSLAAAIARLHDDGALRTRLAIAARERAITCYDEKIIVEQTLRVYRELISSV